MHKNIGNGFIKIGVTQEELENSIAGLQQLKPILQMQVIRGNGGNATQAVQEAGYKIKTKAQYGN